MRALVQRVKRAHVTVDGKSKREINEGLLILLGVHSTDSMLLCEKLAQKCAGLRIFDDENGKLNLSAVSQGFQALVVSNFTLYASTHKGKRPSFDAVAKAPLSENCYNEFVKHLKTQGLANVQTGEFGAQMEIELINDGPVTIMLDTDEWKNKADI